MEEQFIKNELWELKSYYVRIRRIYLFSLLSLLIAFITQAFTKINRFDLIRSKGIIIEDENGRDRILIGAPVPYSKNRVRTDTALVRKY